ncbi:hypothetical protein BaRGS_00012286 [Batillaria attramentaria]|uniref:Uncharacterized protein n=1 Tax=Batillaria attramentaria TaxID=370345 RepID=A0ABD0LA94_9CAEN
MLKTSGNSHFCGKSSWNTTSRGYHWWRKWPMMNQVLADDTEGIEKGISKMSGNQRSTHPQREDGQVSLTLEKHDCTALKE